MVNNKFFCGVINSESTFNIDFTQTLTLSVRFRTGFGVGGFV